MDVYRAEVTFFFNSNRKDGLFLSLVVLLFCAVLLLTVLFLFQNTAIKNTLISKECLSFYVVKK